MNEVNKQKLEQASKYLQENKIDLWLIFASEGSDPAVKLLTGLKTVEELRFDCKRKSKVCGLFCY